MTDLWLAGWDRIPGESSGTWAPDDEVAAKLVLHATEGFAIGDAVNAYKANRSWPHTTVDPVRKRTVQHLPLNVPARALKNTTAPGQTNREANVLQVEIVGTSHLPATAKGKVSLSALTDEQNEWLGRVVVGPMCRLGGVAIKTDVTFYGEDCGWTLASSSARQRLTAAQFDTATGILGHQHVPENDHWDPGPIDIDAIIAAARGAQPPTDKDWLTMATEEEVDALIKARTGEVIGWARALAENPELPQDSNRLADRAKHLNPHRKA